MPPLNVNGAFTMSSFVLLYSTMSITEQFPQALKDLRSSYGMGQQAFATLARMSISSIANYEISTRFPDGFSARRLYLLALKVNRHDLAQVFAKIVADESGELAFYDVHIESESEFHAIRALQLVLKDDRFRAQRKQIAKALAPAQKELQRAAALTRIPAAEIP